jgi:L-galactose dehydrogenase
LAALERRWVFEPKEKYATSQTWKDSAGGFCSWIWELAIWERVRTYKSARQPGCCGYGVDAGINFFDVSPYYGPTLAEERLGQTLEGNRQKVVLATKCGRYGIEEFDFSAKRIRLELEKSLRRLRTDYVDLLQAHDIEFASFDQIVHEVIPAMRELQAEGKARYIGITGYPIGLLKRAAEKIQIDSILSYCRYNLMNTDMDAELVPFVEEREIGLINASPMMMGVLTVKEAPVWHPGSEELKDAGRRAAMVAAQHGANISTLALQFAIARTTVASTLVGMATAEQVKENLRSIETKLDSVLLSNIRAAIGNGFPKTWMTGLPENADPTEDMFY